MSRCPKCYETRCVCDAVQALTRMGHPFVSVAAHVDGLREHIDVLVQEQKSQAAEVARLREALERIVNGVWPADSHEHMRDIARAALGRTP